MDIIDIGAALKRAKKLTGSGGIADANKDGKKYARQNGAWVEVIDAEDIQEKLDVIQEELDEKAGLDYISFDETEPDSDATKLWAPLKN